MREATKVLKPYLYRDVIAIAKGSLGKEGVILSYRVIFITSVQTVLPIVRDLANRRCLSSKFRFYSSVRAMR